MEIDDLSLKIADALDTGEETTPDKDLEEEGAGYKKRNLFTLTMQTEVLKKAEKSLQNEIRSLVDQALRKIQKEYKADVAGFNDQLRIQYPKVWQKVKKDWDKRFSEPKVNYSVKVDIIDYGTKGSKK